MINIINGKDIAELRVRNLMQLLLDPRNAMRTNPYVYGALADNCLFME
jgi:hypothetical protein